MRPISPNMDILPAALSGLSNAEAMLERTAQRLSKLGTVADAPPDPVDLAAEMVNLATAKVEFEANLKSFEAGNEIAKHTIDLLG